MLQTLKTLNVEKSSFSFQLELKTSKRINLRLELEMPGLILEQSNVRTKFPKAANNEKMWTMKSGASASAKTFFGEFLGKVQKYMRTCDSPFSYVSVPRRCSNKNNQFRKQAKFLNKTYTFALLLGGIIFISFLFRTQNMHAKRQHGKKNYEYFSTNILSSSKKKSSS